MKVTAVEQIADLLAKKQIERRIGGSFTKSVREDEEITILYGPRQVGKTAETARCMSGLLREGVGDVFYYNLDEIGEDFERPDAFANAMLARRTQPDKKAYVFLDEAQRLPDVGLFVKYIYDLYKSRIKLVLTGSASLEIKQKIKEPLTGRKKEFFLAPMDIGELLEFRGVKIDQIQGYFGELDRMLREYLRFGGYPGVVVLQDPEEKKAKLTEISQTYVMRDLSQLFDLKRQESLRIVATYLAENVGGLLNLEAVRAAAGISAYEAQKLSGVLEKGFTTFVIRPFFKSTFRELSHKPKVYFQDLGIRNAFLRKVDRVSVDIDKGKLFENMVGIQLVSRFGAERVRFWRTRNQTEVDFVVLKERDDLLAIEAKYAKGRGTFPKGMYSFGAQYHIPVDNMMVISRENYWELWAEKPVLA